MKMIRTPIVADTPLAPDLFGVIEVLLAQLSAPPSDRTARLVRASTAKKARKLVEEATEVALDAVADNRAGLIAESVDLLYHLAVLWHDRRVDPAEIRAEMARRAAVLGIVEKRPKKGAGKRALKALKKTLPGAQAPRPDDPGRSGDRAQVCALYRDGDDIGLVSLSRALTLQ